MAEAGSSDPGLSALLPLVMVLDRPGTRLWLLPVLNISIRLVLDWQSQGQSRGRGQSTTSPDMVETLVEAMAGLDSRLDQP